jgi:hypothetical protein
VLGTVHFVNCARLGVPVIGCILALSAVAVKSCSAQWTASDTGSCPAAENASASQALLRWPEELGYQLRVGDLAFVAENILASDGIQHEIGLYSHVDWPGRLGPDDLRRGGKQGHWFCWLGVQTLASAQFQPAGLIPALQTRPATLKHVTLDHSQPQ